MHPCRMKTQEDILRVGSRRDMNHLKALWSINTAARPVRSTHLDCYYHRKCFAFCSGAFFFVRKVSTPINNCSFTTILYLGEVKTNVITKALASSINRTSRSGYVVMRAVINLSLIAKKASC